MAAAGIAALVELAPAGVTFYSLQKEHVPGVGGTPVSVIDHMGTVEDFADTAALIDTLDLVISIDTAVAHLAGALAKPVWTMLAHEADWRWLEGRADSPWYPTMRLFRQEWSRDWGGVVARLGDALKQFVTER
jgi:hypothetical protein